MPLNFDVFCAIDVDPATNPIFITPYRMAPTELKKLKEHVTPQKIQDRDKTMIQVQVGKSLSFNSMRGDRSMYQGHKKP